METAQSGTARPPGAMDTHGPHPGTGDAASSGGRPWLVVLAMVFGLFMPMLDHLVVNVALPTIQHQLGAGISGLQWIVDAYTLTLAALMLTGGALGDLFGRKRFFLAGLALFTVASALRRFTTSASPGGMTSPGQRPGARSPITQRPRDPAVRASR